MVFSITSAESNLATIFRIIDVTGILDIEIFLHILSSVITVQRSVCRSPSVLEPFGTYQIFGTGWLSWCGMTS